MDHASISLCLDILHSDVVAVTCKYRYQLEAFVDKLRGRTPGHWFDAQDSITNMEWIEAIYKEVGHAYSIPPSSNVCSD
jgi:hypothetical protein